MKLRVGIPRALFYYYHYPAWEKFFKQLGAEVVVSPATHKGILNAGVTSAVDEACLPVKVFYGHVLELIPQVDLIFVPRLVSVEPKTYICPKFMGLPDMIRANLPQSVPIIDLCVDVSRSQRQLRQELRRIAGWFTDDLRQLKRAERAAMRQLQEFQRLLEEGYLPTEAIARMGEEEADSVMRCRKVRKEDGQELTIALLGHGYTIYDDYLNHRLIDRLRSLGARVVTADHLSPRVIEQEARRLPKRMFWTLGKKIIGAAFHFLDNPSVDGIIHLSCFGCGPDSLVAELVEIEAHRRRRPPFMMLTLDEHTGEAGLVTRLEAFVDLLRRLKNNRAQNQAV